MLIGAIGTLAGCSTEGATPSASPFPNVSVDPALREALPAETRADGYLTIVTDPSYPPMEFIEPTESGSTVGPVGADIDLGRAIASKFGLNARFEQTPFSNVIPSVAIQEFELGISSLWVDSPAASMVNMVTYLKAGTQLASHASSATTITNVSAICGKSVAVEESAEYIDTLVKRSVACVKAGSAPVTIETANSQARAAELLEDNKVDAMVGDTPTVQYTIARSNGSIVAVGNSIDVRPYGIAVSPKYPEMTKATQTALQQLIDSGVYLDILRKWNIADGAIKKSEVLFGV